MDLPPVPDALWPLVILGRIIMAYYALLIAGSIIHWAATWRSRRPYPSEPGAWAHVPRRDWPKRRRGR